MVDVTAVEGTVNRSIRDELETACQCGYDREELADEIRGDDAIFIVGTVDGGEVSVRELTSLDEGVRGDLVGTVGARVMDFETFDRYVGSAGRLVAESDGLSRSEFPVCEVGRWYVAPESQGESVGLRMMTELLREVPRLDTYPLIGEAWQKDGRRDGHIDLFLRSGARKVGETRWGPPGSPDAVDAPDERDSEAHTYSVLRHDRETIAQLHDIVDEYGTEHLMSMVEQDRPAMVADD